MSSFQIIKAETRTARMIGWFQGICATITDFVAGSKIRSKFETVAVEMEAQDFAFYQAMKKAIPLSIYQAFGFSLRPAIRASGIVTFGAASAPLAPITIPKGTKVTVSGGSKVYETTAAATLAETSVDVSVICTTSGAIGNTPPQTITEMNNSINGIDTITNTTGITNGQEREIEADRKIRFVEYITTLTRGTKTAVEYGAKTAAILDTDGNIIEKVSVAKVVEPFMDDPIMPVGIFVCYVYNGVGSTSTDLVTMTQNIIDGYRDSSGNQIPGYKAAGVVGAVTAVSEKPTDVTVNVTTTPYTSVAAKTYIQNASHDAIATYIATLGISNSLLTAEIINAIMSIDGVYNAAVASPSIDTTAAVGEIITPGTITVTVT